MLPRDYAPYLVPGADGAVDLHGTCEAGTEHVAATVTVGAVSAVECTDLHLRPLPSAKITVS